MDYLDIGKILATRRTLKYATIESLVHTIRSYERSLKSGDYRSRELHLAELKLFKDKLESLILIH